MSMIEDMTKEMQDVRDEHKIQMDQIKGVSTNVPTDNKLEIYQQIWIMLKGLFLFRSSEEVNNLLNINK
jgi:hypothetical protein